MPSSVQAVDLLWTGGWDSTFQLLRLLLDHRLPVTPYYLIDEGRRSSDVEIETMERIRERLSRSRPHTRELLLPTRYRSVSSLAPDAEIDAALVALRRRRFLGRQYEWLARFCKQSSISGMQLCIHRDDRARAAIEGLVSAATDVPTGGLRVDPGFDATPEYSLFRYFTFPVFDLGKVEMGRIADERGFGAEMELTWFCHDPGPDLLPCGLCNPCRYTIEEGLAWRVPADRRARTGRLLLRKLRQGLVAALRRAGLRR